VSSFRLACLTYLFVALPGSTLGMVWPSARLDLHEPVGALGVVLVASVAASVVSSVVTGQVVTRLPVPLFMALGTGLTSVGLAVEAVAWSLWIFAAGSVLFGVGWGAVNSALNAHAARHFGPRDVTWIHASYGLGAIVGPLLVTAILSGGLSWRDAFWIFAAIQGVVGCVLAAARAARPHRVPTPRTSRPTTTSALIGTLVIAAVETGIETGAGIWGYVFLTSGRGLGPEAAGLAVSAYWAMMFVGRVVLGPVAERVGASLVLNWAIGGVAVGAALMVVPGNGIMAVAAMMVVGLGAAPIFPLLALTTVDRPNAVAWQAAASSTGAAALPAGMGLAIGASQAAVLAPLLLALSAAMCVVHVLVRRTAGPPTT
jgi:MFS family permease